MANRQITNPDMMRAVTLCKVYKPHFKEVKISNMPDKYQPWVLQVITHSGKRVEHMAKHCRDLDEVEKYLKEWRELS